LTLNYIDLYYKVETKCVKFEVVRLFYFELVEYLS
jgi:hypothetical protein